MDGFRQRPASQQSSSKISKFGGGGGGRALSPSSRQHQQQRSRHGHVSSSQQHQQGVSAASGGFGSSSHLITGSVTGGGFSVYPQRDETMLNEKYFPRDDDYFSRQRAGSSGDGEGDDRHSSSAIGQHNHHHHGNQLKHPHIQVRGLGYAKATSSGERQHLLQDITFEARAGEILGLLTTSGIIPSSSSYSIVDRSLLLVLLSARVVSPLHRLQHVTTTDVKIMSVT